MNTFYPWLKTTLVFITLTAALISKAQSTLEFSSASASTTATGASTADQVITFLQNSSTGNSYTPFSTPTTTVTVALGNQQYSLSSSQISTQTGSSFGADYSSTATAASVALFQQLNSAGSGLNSNFTVAPGAGAGINAVNDYGVVIFNSALALQNAGRSTNGRWYMSDLTITFSTPINSPVIHLAGLGGTSGQLGFTTEFDLVTSGITLTKLSGSPEFSVNSTQILNSAAAPTEKTGSGAATGSVLVNGANVTSLTFKMYLRGDGLNSQWSSSGHAGDGFLLSVSSWVTAVSLPATLTRFVATAENNAARLDWTTAMESNSSYFYVEYSTDRNSWETIGSVQAADNSTTSRSYEFTQGHLVAGNNFYRLKMVDRDGTFTYSKVAGVSGGEANKITFYPNPVKSNCTVNTNSTTPQSLTLSTLDGRMLQQSSSFANGGSIDLSSYPNGIYLIAIRNTSGKSEVLKVMKD